MLNFSVVGRNASEEQREAYSKWDKSHMERYSLTQDIRREFPNLDAAIGGRISIDIYPRGNDKGQAIKDLKRTYPSDRLSFSVIV